MELLKALDSPGSFDSLSAEIVDASGFIVAPGLVDIHVHLREPGFEWKETVLTGAQAAVAGGFYGQFVVCQIQTQLMIPRKLQNIFLDKAQAAGLARSIANWCYYSWK